MILIGNDQQPINRVYVLYRDTFARNCVIIKDKVPLAERFKKFLTYSLMHDVTLSEYEKSKIITISHVQYLYNLTRY